jgi:iron-sulfur cluster repair protein YtfE (RIC family)
MPEIVALIDAIIEEHKVIFERLQALEQVANDVQGIVALDKAKDTFVPGRFDQSESLKKMRHLLEVTSRGLEAHFDREEKGLLAAVEKHGDKKLASALHTLLLEHKDLRNRFTQSKNHITELTSQRLSRHVWDATAHDMRAHISHTRKLLEAHAQIEMELLKELRAELTRTKGKASTTKE